jgi:hypothetical protein
VAVAEPEHALSLDAVVAETRAAVAHLGQDVAGLVSELRTDIRRLDDRILQMLVIPVATLATALGSLVAALVSVTR